MEPESGILVESVLDWRKSELNGIFWGAARGGGGGGWLASPTSNSPRRIHQTFFGSLHHEICGSHQAATKKYGARLDKVFFANSDRVFGGSRPGFERAATMMSRIESDYFRKTLTTYYPLDWDLVLRSDWNGQLHWPGIVFPRDVLDPERLT